VDRSGLPPIVDSYGIEEWWKACEWQYISIEKKQSKYLSHKEIQRTLRKEIKFWVSITRMLPNAMDIILED
jgi:hypothetical protein